MTLEEKLYEASGDWAVQKSCTHGPLMREAAEHIEALKKCLKAACDDYFGEDWSWYDEAEVLLGRDPKERYEALKERAKSAEASSDYWVAQAQQCRSWLTELCARVGVAWHGDREGECVQAAITVAADAGRAVEHIAESHKEFAENLDNYADMLARRDCTDDVDDVIAMMTEEAHQIRQCAANGTWRKDNPNAEGAGLVMHGGEPQTPPAGQSKGEP